MKSKTIAGLILLLIATVILVNSFYLVMETQKGVQLRFGALIEKDITPGVHLKIPLIDKVRLFDARVLTVDANPESFYTIQKKRLIVDSFMKWRIVNVGTYYRSTGGDQDVANNRLEARVNDGLRNEFGVRTLHEVVAGERDELMVTLAKELNSKVLETLGIEVIDVRIKRIDLPDEVSDDVYRRMRAERDKQAQEYRSEGREAAEKIKADADRQKILIEVKAYKKSEIIRGEGDAVAAKIYAKAYEKDPEFYSFQRSLNAYRNSFNKGQDIILIEPDNDFFRYFNKRKGK